MPQPKGLSSASPFERLPLELRLRIISWTRGDDHDQPIAYIENRPKSRRLDFGHNRFQPNLSFCLNLLLVNRQMYSDAFDVLYRESKFVFAPAGPKTLLFVDRLPRAGLQRIQHLRLRASVGDVELILYNTWNDWAGKRWIKLAEMLKQNCDLARLQVEVDLKIVSTWCQGEDVRSEERCQAAYQFYLFITSIMCKLRHLKDIKFNLDWARGLAPWMERQVLGTRSFGKVEELGAKSGVYEVTIASYVPHWHRDDESIQGFTFAQDGVVSHDISSRPR